MEDAEADSFLVDETSDGGQAGGDLSARGAALATRRETVGITAVELEKETGIARQTIARAEKGQASKATYRQLEAWFDRFDEESGANAPRSDARIVTLEVEGVFGIGRVAVKGPIDNPSALRKILADLIADLRDTPPSNET